MEEKITNVNEQTVEEQATEQQLIPKTFDLSIKDGIFTLLFCVASLLFSSFGLFGGFRGGFTASFLVIFGVISAYLFTKNIKISSIYVLVQNF